MLYSLAKILQLVGMAQLPIGLYLGIAHKNIRYELALLVTGGILFLIGWLMERKI